MLLDSLLAYIIACCAITEQRINPLTQPMPFPCALFRQRQHIIFPVAIVVHFGKTNHPIREIFDFLLRIVHQAVDFFFVILGQCRRQTVHQFFRCSPVIQLESKIHGEISLLIIENRFFLLLIGNQLFRILHRGHALCTPFCHRRFQLFQKVGSGQSNRIHRIFQFLHLLAAGPACHIRERVIGRINAQSRADRKCNAFSFGFFRKSVFFLAVLLHEIAVMQHRMSDFMDHSLYGLALSHTDLNADFFVCITVIAFSIPFDFIKPNRHRRYLFDCRRKQRIVLNAGRQFMRSQFRKRFTIGLRNIEDRCYAETRNHILHTFHFRLTVFVQHHQTRILVDFLASFHFLDGSRSNDLDALFAFFNVTVELILPCVKPCHQCGIGPLHSDQQRIVEAVIVEFCHRAQIRRVHFRCKNVLYALLQPFRDFFHLLFAVNCHANPPFS